MKGVYNESNSDPLHAAYFYSRKCIKCANGLKNTPAENKIINIPQD